MERLAWQRVGPEHFYARPTGPTSRAEAVIMLIEGHWWWRVSWPERFSHAGAIVVGDRQAAADAATDAWWEAVTTTDAPANAAKGEIGCGEPANFPIEIKAHI